MRTGRKSMSLIKTEGLEEQEKRCREFGQLMGLVFILAGGYFLWHFNPSSLYFFGISLVFLLGAIFMPLSLGPLERAWMAFAEKLSVVMTYVIVTLTFIVAITPMGLLLKVLRKDLLGLALEPEKRSYWEPVPDDSPGTRPFSPF